MLSNRSYISLTVVACADVLVLLLCFAKSRFELREVFVDLFNCDPELDLLEDAVLLRLGVEGREFVDTLKEIL